MSDSFPMGRVTRTLIPVDIGEQPMVTGPHDPIHGPIPTIAYVQCTLSRDERITGSRRAVIMEYNVPVTRHILSPARCLELASILTRMAQE